MPSHPIECHFTAAGCVLLRVCCTLYNGALAADVPPSLPRGDPGAEPTWVCYGLYGLGKFSVSLP